MLMQYNAQIIRGWPFDGSLDRAEPIKAGVTLVNGDWVQKQADNTVDKVGATKSFNAGLVVRGNGDSGSSANTNKATVVWGNFIAQVQTGLTLTPGQALTVQNGALVEGTIGTDPIIGFVLDVISASAVNTASMIVRIF